MGFRSIVRARLALFVALSALALFGALSATASAAEAPWGSLGNFRLPACAGETCEPGHVRLKSGEGAVSVDPRDGSFFLAYKPDEFKVGEHTRERLIVQRYSASGAAGAKLELKVPNEEGKKEEGELGLGVQAAFDPADNRLYVLVRWEREEPASSPSPGGYVAGALYAFEYKEEKLVSLAQKEEKPAPILGKEGFKSQGESAKEPLVHPLGLAVDPTTKNVAIIGEQNESASKEIKEGKEKCRAAVQWVKVEEVSKELHGKLAKRYLDSANVLGKHYNEGKTNFESEECGEGEEASLWQPYSPVITPTGRLLAMTTSESSSEEGAIWEVPAPFNEATGEQSTTPKFLYAYPSAAGSEKQLELETGAEEATEATNPTMSLVADGASEGKLYVGSFYSAHLPESGASAPSVLALHYAEKGSETQIAELGWVGGYHHYVQKAEEPSEIEAAACSLPNGQTGGVVGIPSNVVVVGGYKGAGGEGVMAFKTGFQDMLVGLDLGPAGDVSKCLRTGLEPVKVISGGVENPAFVSVGIKATLESQVAAGILSSVEWEFEYTTPQGAKGTEPTVTQTGAQLPLDLTETSLEHVFHHPGTYKVTETIHSFGNLAGVPEATVTKSIAIHSNLKIQLAEPESVPNGEAPAHIAATVNVPGGAEGEQVEYAWKFGDGTSQPAKIATLNGKHEVRLSAEHTFSSRCGGRCSVTLEVLESPEGSATAETTIAVSENATERKEHEQKPPPPPPVEEGHTTTTPPPSEGPHQEVKASKEGNPEAKLASSALSVSSAGALAVKVTCPAGEASCVGTLTLRTASAVSAGHGKKKAILTLASGSFTVTGGQAKTLTLHLSSPARALLAHLHTLQALATLVAHDPTGASRTVKSRATLRLVARKGKH